MEKIVCFVYKLARNPLHWVFWRDMGVSSIAENGNTYLKSVSISF